MKLTNLTIKDLLTDDIKLTFLVGAGCSVDTPSCLPAGRPMMEAIINYTCAESEKEKILKIKDLRFEQLVEIIRDRIDPELKLIDYYGQCDKPNLQHFFLADMIKKGHFVMTTNFDFLIEYALLQINIPKENIVPVITKSDFETNNNPKELFLKGKKTVYKIHGSTKNLITGENTKDSLVATIQAFGSNKEGLNVFQAQPFQRESFDNLTDGRSLMIMGYSGSDDFDVVPTLKVLKNLRNVIWINHVNREIERVYEIDESSELREEKVNEILLGIKQRNNADKVYRVDVNTTKIVKILLDIDFNISNENFDINPSEWLRENIKKPSEIMKYAIPYEIYFRFSLHDEGMICLNKIFQIAEAERAQQWMAYSLSRLGRILTIKSDFPEALEKFEKALEIYDQIEDLHGKAFTLNNIGLNYEAQQKAVDSYKWFEDALKIYEQIGDLDGKAGCLTSIGLYYRRLAFHEEAIKVYKMALEVNDKVGDLSRKTDLLSKLADIYNVLGRMDEMIEIAEESLKIAELIGDPYTIVTALKNLGNYQEKRDNLPEAYRNFEEAIKILEKHGLNDSPVAREINMWYHEFLRRQREGVTRLDDETGKYVIEGSNFMALGQYEEALECYEKILEINKNDIDALYKKGRCLLLLEQYEEALECSDKILEIDINYKAAINQKGVCLLHLKQIDESLKYFNKLLEFDSQDPYALNNKGLCLLILEQYEEALECFNKILEVDQNNIRAINQKGLCLLYLKHYDESLECFNKLLELNPTDSYAWYNKACVESLKNETIKAIQSLKKAIELNVEFKNLAKNESDFNNIKNLKEFHDLLSNELNRYSNI
ncbi:MAG: tetratricopeptide repeat protein [Promethearchaeota archaeon]